MTEGPTGPRTDAPELASAASLPTRSARGVQGCRGLGPEVKGSCGSSCGSLGSSLPQAGRAGRRALGRGSGWGRHGPARQMCAHSHPAWAAGCQGQSGLARNPSGLPVCAAPPWPVSSLGVPAQPWPPWALCCTYSRLVFIPCADDILFLLSVSVFMCAELLACCARARGELVPRDWTA